ncbi:MAG: alpha-ketoglutarate-dependent dioxygenase AlkB [Flavobacteriaceae bacterium]|nr:alpha-ketoglutarate-dependent dioxygenase AlkB [Flavobacteriaceae bacterium]
MNLLANSQNLLPYDGEVYYLKDFLPRTGYLGTLIIYGMKSNWKNDEVWIFGKKITTARKTAWYGNPGLIYTYSKVSRTALPWTECLSELKNRIEEISHQQFNACLLNLYHNGLEGVSWHSDDEKELGKEPVIASLSLGSGKEFCF